jgi:phosphohistidine phosphatase SixA
MLMEELAERRHSQTTPAVRAQRTAGRLMLALQARMVNVMSGANPQAQVHLLQSRLKSAQTLVTA